MPAVNRRREAGTALEPHFTPAQLGELWGLPDDCIRDLFRDEPGVLKLVQPETMHKRSCVSLRIPQSVVERVGARLAA